MSRQEDMIRRILEAELQDIRERFISAPPSELPEIVVQAPQLSGYGLEGVKAELVTIEQLIRSILPQIQPQEEEEQDDPVLNDLLANPPTEGDSPEREDDWVDRVAERLKRRLKPHPVLDEAGRAFKGLGAILWNLFSAGAENLGEALHNFLLGYKLWNLMNLTRQVNQNILKVENELTRIESAQGDEKQKLERIQHFMDHCAEVIQDIDGSVNRIEGGISLLNPTRQADQTLDLVQRMKVLQSDVDDIRGLLRQATLGTRYLS